MRVKRRGSSRQTRGFHETEKTLVTRQDSGSDSCEDVRLYWRGEAPARAEPTVRQGRNIPEALDMLARCKNWVAGGLGFDKVRKLAVNGFERKA